MATQIPMIHEKKLDKTNNDYIPVLCFMVYLTVGGSCIKIRLLYIVIGQPVKKKMSRPFAD